MPASMLRGEGIVEADQFDMRRLCFDGLGHHHEIVLHQSDIYRFDGCIRFRRLPSLCRHPRRPGRGHRSRHLRSSRPCPPRRRAFSPGQSCSGSRSPCASSMPPFRQWRWPCGYCLRLASPFPDAGGVNRLDRPGRIGPNGVADREDAEHLALAVRVCPMAHHHDGIEP